MVIVHHIGKAAKGKSYLDRIRGASAYNAAARAIFFLKRQDDIAVQCLKMNRTPLHPEFRIHLRVNTREVDQATWKCARLSYRHQAEWERDRAEALVIRLLNDSPEPLNSTDLKKKSKGTRVSVIAVSHAIKRLHDRGEISYEEGDHKAKNWYITGKLKN